MVKWEAQMKGLDGSGAGGPAQGPGGGTGPSTRVQRVCGGAQKAQVRKAQQDARCLVRTGVDGGLKHQ